MVEENIKKNQLNHYLALVKRMKEAHEMLIDKMLKTNISTSGRTTFGKPYDLDFWRNRANAIEDSYRHIWEYYNKNRLQYEKDFEPKEAKKKDG